MSTETQPYSDSFNPLRRPLNLRESVLEQLRTAIITGALAEGTVVSAPTLGKALGVSATPVREAMMDLAREGLIETIKNKGFRITAMSDKELDDLAEIRLLIEPPSMHSVVGRISNAKFGELRGLADLCLRAAEDEDLDAYLRHDRELHARILAHTGNPQLVDLATTLRLRTRMYGLAVLAKKGQLAESAREHHRLIQLLEAGNGAGAERLLHEHINHAREIWATGGDEDAGKPAEGSA